MAEGSSIESKRITEAQDLSVPEPPDAAQDETQADYLSELNKALHKLWNLGRNVVLVWSPSPGGITVLVIPHYEVADLASSTLDVHGDFGGGFGNDMFDLGTKSFIEDVISGHKRATTKDLLRIGGLLKYDPIPIDLPIVPGQDLDLDAIDTLVKRYGISYVEDRAVALFDIVNFTLYTPLEQVTQLNSLAYSVNAAHSKMLTKEIDISFARSTTGDGFYIWNRDRSIQANVNLYHFMHLVLADNAIARRKSKSNATPLLRTCFHLGGHYEFYQSEGLSPTIYSYIVGDVTIELARMIDRAMPGQVMVGDFRVPMPDLDTGLVSKIDTVEFIKKTQENLSSLKGLVLSGDEIESIKCYLTGERTGDGAYSIAKHLISDKHGRTRNIYNAKINIYRKQAEPIFLGVRAADLTGLEAAGTTVVAP